MDKLAEREIEVPASAFQVAHAAPVDRQCASCAARCGFRSPARSPSGKGFDEHRDRGGARRRGLALLASVSSRGFYAREERLADILDLPTARPTFPSAK